MTLSAVPGVQVGHHTHRVGRTGVTVVLTRAGARGAVFVPGGASGTRELETLEPRHVAPVLHAICLAGGSAFGLAAADGVTNYLAELGVGFPTAGGPVPIVPAAILYDLHTATVRPDAAMGRQAAAAASDDPVPTGAVGAGTGAMVGLLWGDSQPGGLGSASAPLGAHIVGALVALNAAGTVRDPSNGDWLTGPPSATGAEPIGRQQTTLAVVATDLPMSSAQLQTVARMASAALARTLHPAFTPFDGDVVFALSTGEGPPADPSAVAAVGHLAAQQLERAIIELVRGDLPAL